MDKITVELTSWTQSKRHAPKAASDLAIVAFESVSFKLLKAME